VAEPALTVFADLPRPGAGQRVIASAIEGLDALYLAELAAGSTAGQILYVARDGVRANQFAELIGFFAPDLEVAVLPAWDCLPYDRVSPNPDIMAQRLDTLARLLEADGDRPRLVITTVNALVQKVPPPEALRAGLFAAGAGERIDRAALLGCLAQSGYRRSGTVVEPGEYAVRGGIIDIFPSGSERPLRLDLFGDELERIRAFDPLSQRSLGDVAEIRLRPVSEVLLDDASIERFRVGYLQQFGAVTGDPLFESVSAGRPYPGMEHWLPLFHERLVPITDYLAPDWSVGSDHLAEAALESRHETIGEHY
jgi:transcription-repair coupling factor (superfamily II helicase)